MHPHEFHVLAESGEDDIAFSDGGDFAANVEMAEALPPETARASAEKAMNEIATPGQHSIEEVSAFLSIPSSSLVKTLLVKGAHEEGEAAPLVALVVRGDHQLNAVKAEKLPEVASPFEFADEAQIAKALQCKPGSIGPVGMDMTVIVDHSAAQLSDFVCGANKDGFHLEGVNWERDCQFTRVTDIRNVVDGDPSPDGKGTLNIKKGIEVGHIFQLGDKYSKAMKATILNQDQKNEVMTMGCYGIGVSRIVASAIEQNHDDKGIIWPEAIAPFQLAIIPINMHKSEDTRAFCENLYSRVSAKGVEVLFMDEEKARLGGMLADVELIGIPHRVVIGDRGLGNGLIEYKGRSDADNQDIPVDEIDAFLTEKIGV